MKTENHYVTRLDKQSLFKHRKILLCVQHTGINDSRRMRKRICILCLLILLLSGGCVRTQPGKGDSVSFSGEINATNSEFIMNGTVGPIGSIFENRYEGVRVYLYSKNGTLIHHKDIGYIKSRKSISIYSSKIPYYVIIYSPEFWNQSHLSVTYYERAEQDGYIPHYASGEEDLPIVPK